ncbi:hypothetical protein KI387_038757 [Taxus chinensis]|uniref:Glycosyltransferase N-terminal domain-containing protein n=1 Tax=Taxus chinensis TaxID=29808 RepID=A0AA38CDW5_TAXCH|nr:hypothetical protein KI387_038757 [Taxus chinensis]
MDAAQEKEQEINVVMVPWLAQGHINPFINLCKTLASHGAVRLSFVSTPVNISRTRARFHGDQPIELLELALPLVDGLPLGAECTSDIKPEMSHLLHAAFGRLEKPFENLLRRLSPDFVIHDLPAHWAGAVAAKLGIPSLVFDVYSPVASSYVLSQARSHGSGSGTTKTPEDLTRPPPDYPSAAISWRLFEARQVLRLFVPGHGGAKVTDFMWAAYQRSSGILIKSCFEEEEKYLQYLRDGTGKPVISAGPLMLPLPGVPVQDKPDPVSDSGGYIIRWLDKQQPCSVVFASFGSESFLTGEQIKELASALEDSGLPFLWSLRVCDGTSSLSSLLPEGFEARTRDRGLVVGGWVPQVRIVSHLSVGCYVTHGGWSSVMEAWFYSGLPLVLIPLLHDQGLNCRQVAQELMAGLEVDRASENGSFRKEDVTMAVMTVMAEENTGAKIRLKVKQLRDQIIVNTGRQQMITQSLVKHMRKVLVDRKDGISSP